MTNNKRFICDKCGRWINNASEGCLLWHVEDETYQHTGFKIVHNGCSSNAKNCFLDYRRVKGLMDLNLTDLVGNDGLATLLAILGKWDIKDKKEFIEIIRRIHIPHYEEARKYWHQAKADGLFYEPTGQQNEIFPFIQATLQEIIAQYKPE